MYDEARGYRRSQTTPTPRFLTRTSKNSRSTAGVDPTAAAEQMTRRILTATVACTERVTGEVQQESRQWKDTQRLSDGGWTIAGAPNGEIAIAGAGHMWIAPTDTQSKGGSGSNGDSASNASFYVVFPTPGCEPRLGAATPLRWNSGVISPSHNV